MNRRRRRHESTAYHEAGHAVAAFVLSSPWCKFGFVNRKC